MAFDSIDPYYAGKSAMTKSGLILYGKGEPECDPELPTLSIGKENLINKKEEWDVFVK